MRSLRALFFGDVPHRIAGAQKSLLTAVLRAREYGLEPVMVFPAEGAFEKKCRADGLRVHVLPGPPSFSVFGKALLRKSLVDQAAVIVRETLPYARRLARLVEEERADVVHFNTARGIILAGWGAHLAGRNTVMHQRGSVAVGRLYWLAAQCLADHVLLVARALMPEVFPSMRERASVLYNGVNVDLPIHDRAEARAEVARWLGDRLAMDEDTRLFVSLSTPAPFKGLHHLLDAAALAKRRGVRAAYVLAGEPRPGGYALWLSRKLSALGLGDTVAIVGFVEDTHRLLCAADALILPSVEHERIEADGEVFEDRSNEGLPRSILEAMVAGIPSIASDIAGVSEQIEDGSSGLLVPPRDPAALAAAIEELARGADLRARMGVRAHQIAESRFRIEDAARGLVDALARVAAEPSSLARKLARWPSLARDAVDLPPPR
jgi:glycosyltransferase involved in cell wall biosynthesis